MIEETEAIEVFYGEVPLWPTDVKLKVFIGNLGIPDVMTRMLGESPLHWAEIVGNNGSLSFFFKGMNNEDSIVMYLDDNRVDLLIREALASVWILAQKEKIKINEDNLRLISDFVVYIVKAVFNYKRHGLDESED
jgi:hypothetical protein